LLDNPIVEHLRERESGLNDGNYPQSIYEVTEVSASAYYVTVERHINWSAVHTYIINHALVGRYMCY